jgi:glycosyltransferase involved in cell wall biosynthesis
MAIARIDTGSDLAVLEPLVQRPAPRKATRTATTRVALIHLGNSRALGTTRRVEVWQELLTAAELDVVEVNLLGDHRRLVPSPLAAVPSFGGHVVPETATWSSRGAERAIRGLDPDVVVFVTPRAFHPRLAEVGRHNILDFQDRFSRSYSGRAAVDRRPGATTAWKVLSWAVARFEERDHSVQTVAAGWSEADAIGATWIPNIVEAVSPDMVTDHADAPFDGLFFGKLSALPNLDAMRQLAELWPALLEEVPNASLLVAGNDLCDEVIQHANTQGWSAESDFDDVTELCQRARLALAPLRHANGIQNKVLEAAAAGLPLIVSPQALGGTAPGFPAMVVRTPEATIAAIRLLLENPDQRLQLAREAHAHVVARYSVERWAPIVHDLVMN